MRLSTIHQYKTVQKVTNMSICRCVAHVAQKPLANQLEWPFQNSRPGIVWLTTQVHRPDLGHLFTAKSSNWGLS